MFQTLKSNSPFSAPRDDTARASCGNGAKSIFLSLKRIIIRSVQPACAALLLVAAGAARGEIPRVVHTMFENRCLDCHDADSKKGNLDLTALKPDFGDTETFGTWLKVHDRIASGEMPPKKKARPEVGELKAVTAWMAESLVKAERTRLDGESRTGVRRLSRAEYENTVRDLFDLPGLALQSGLPADGSAHGFDKNSEALDISHVNLAKYLEAADKTLDLAIATQPQAPERQTHRISLARHVYLILMNGDAVMLKDQRRDTTFPASGEHYHVGPGEHFSAPRDDTARASCGNGAKSIFLSLTSHKATMRPNREAFFASPFPMPPQPISAIAG